ncbi:rubisco accumulation factor 1.1, chloroplastic-like [Salvia miltiorrhiza]|uniref:rubisco accumulation factor 1.1, chloroplastic-like n=1 Tax=Salvia miltiorrhiza TaxID=226208 RepID=UPI0025AC7423|nr:rubisco accumulation factor 1.1, chloroplastic-like [Salvia miltiorrhiza]
MVSLTANTTPKPFLSTPFLPHLHLHPHPSLFKPSPKPLSISALILPYSSTPSRNQNQKQQPPQLQQVYQPYRAPPSPLPARYRTLDTLARLEILTNRLGLWFEYASLIPSLISEGFTSSTLEEITGIPSIEQNLLVVAGQVRDSLIEATDAETVSYFDNSGSAEILYEIRILNTPQRAAAARFIIKHGFDANRAEELARSMKDHPRRFEERGWEYFDGNIPGDCLAFMFFRQAHEHKTASSPDWTLPALQKALEMAETERARLRVLEDLEGKEEEAEIEDEVVTAAPVPVVRLVYGEVAESSAVVVLPVCRAEGREMEVQEAPWECGMRGNFGIVEAEKSWSGWVVLPGWLPIAGLGRGGAVVRFPKAKGVLPWKDKRKDVEEEILVVVDRGQKEVVAEDGFYLVVGGGNGSGDEALKVERGVKLKQTGVESSLGTVLLVVRPPRDDVEDQLVDDD